MMRASAGLPPCTLARSATMSALLRGATLPRAFSRSGTLMVLVTNSAHLSESCVRSRASH